MTKKRPLTFAEYKGYVQELMNRFLYNDETQTIRLMFEAGFDSQTCAEKLKLDRGER